MLFFAAAGFYKAAKLKGQLTQNTNTHYFLTYLQSLADGFMCPDFVCF